MDEGQRARRPGGRSARVGAQVHRAVTDLIGERGYGKFTVGDVAVRAGVADSSIYRRWGDLETLLTDVALTRLDARSPMPDTGSLAGDLRTYAAQVAREITGPDGLLLVRLAVALPSIGEQGVRARDDLRDERTRQLQSMLDRAVTRGEARTRRARRAGPRPGPDVHPRPVRHGHAHPGLHRRAGRPVAVTRPDPLTRPRVRQSGAEPRVHSCKQGACNS
ncbi:hypothetical protein SVIOM342S_01575 [Streptomyces violaceorubidus]